MKGIGLKWINAFEKDSIKMPELFMFQEGKIKMTLWRRREFSHICDLSFPAS